MPRQTDDNDPDKALAKTRANSTLEMNEIIDRFISGDIKSVKHYTASDIVVGKGDDRLAMLPRSGGGGKTRMTKNGKFFK